MSTSIKDIAWLAGLFEGEGCFFTSGKTCFMVIEMTDLDTIEKVKYITKFPGKIYEIKDPRNDSWKLRYKVQLSQTLAAQWMMTIYPLMGLRRKSKIREVLHYWKNITLVKSTPNGRNQNPNISIIRDLIKIGLTKEQATLRLDHFLKDGAGSPLTSQEENDIVSNKVTVN